MVITTGPQLNGTWLVWKSFMYPAEDGPKWAFAVPNRVADQLNSAYSLMLDLLVAQFWVLVVGLVVAVMLQNKGALKNYQLFNSLMPSLWNKNSNLLSAATDVFMSVVTQDGRATPSVKMWMVLAVALALYAGQKALSILVAPKIILGTVAPVKPDVVYFPEQQNVDEITVLNRFILSTPWALRAVATATAAMASLSKSVFVSRPVQIGTWGGSTADPVDSSNPPPIYRYTYNYSVTGADMGIQHYPELKLNIEGACFTEYNWYVGSETTSGYNCLDEEVYYLDDNASYNFTLSALNGPLPALTFLSTNAELPGTLPGSNSTWLAATSASGKYSYTASTDPWYLTTVSNNTAPFKVAARRPALSCWEDAVWTYHGKQANISGLNDLPGVHLSDGVYTILSNSLIVPMISHMGSFLGSASLSSGGSTLGRTIDAGANSIASDLQRLVVAAYVATTNVFTSTTLYPINANQKVGNEMQSTSGQPIAGTGDFVVWTTNAAALDLKVVIAVPVVLVVLLLLNIFLALATPIGKTKALSPMEMFYFITQNHSTAEIGFKRWGEGNWQLKSQVKSDNPPNKAFVQSESQTPGDVISGGAGIKTESGNSV